MVQFKLIWCLNKEIFIMKYMIIKDVTRFVCVCVSVSIFKVYMCL